MSYEQHPPTRDVTTSNFPNGAIHFRFETSGEKWWMPSKSYLRMRCRLTKGDGTTPVDIGDDVAPNMGLMSNLFQSGEMRLQDKVLSRIPDFMSYVDALDTRLTKSSSWLNSIGSATNWWDADQAVRQTETAADGVIIDPNAAAVQDETSRVDMNFDAAGGLLAERNQWSYVDATGVMTYVQGTDAPNGLTVAQAKAQFPIGSYFRFVGVAGVPNTPMRVLINDLAAAPGTITVQNLLGVDVPTSGINDFARVMVTFPDANQQASRRAGEFEMTWQPPLSVFKVGHALPSGRYEMILNPQTVNSFQKRAIESVLGSASKSPTLPGGGAGDYQFEVVDFYLYTATVNGPRADNVTYLLDLEQTRCQSEKITTNSFAQRNFDVSPSTYALTVAYADVRAGEHTAISASKFKSYETAVAGAAVSVPQELNLERFFINYAGQNLPAPDANPDFKAGTDYTIQRYAETQIYSGAYYDTGGAETIQEFHDRGAYYYFSWPRDGTDRSTRVNVHSGFKSTTDKENLRVLLFDHSKQVARVRVQDGRVVDVQLEDS